MEKLQNVSSDFEEVGNDGMDSKTTENETVGTDAEIASSFQTGNEILDIAMTRVLQLFLVQFINSAPTS